MTLPPPCSRARGAARLLAALFVAVAPAAVHAQGQGDSARPTAAIRRDAAALLEAARAAWARGDRAMAERHWREAARLAPNDPAVLDLRRRLDAEAVQRPRPRFDQAPAAPKSAPKRKKPADTPPPQTRRDQPRLDRE